ncbi:MAG: hypothetical protein U1E83_01255 [Methylotetracoccus sp.]
MAIYRKDHVAPYKLELAEYYHEIVHALDGSEPEAGLAEHFHRNPDQFKREFTDIDFDRVLRCIDRFAATVKCLKQLKAKAADTIHRGR